MELCNICKIGTLVKREERTYVRPSWWAKLFGSKDYTRVRTTYMCNNPTCPLNELEKVDEDIRDGVRMITHCSFFGGMDIHELVDKLAVKELYTKRKELMEKIRVVDLSED